MTTRRAEHGGHQSGEKPTLPVGFDDRDSEVEYWNETDITELEPGELEEVKVGRPKRPNMTTFAIRLDHEAVELLRTIARIHDLGHTQLVREWVMDRLEIEKRAGVLAKPVLDTAAVDENTVRTKAISMVMSQIPGIVETVMKEVLDEVVDEAAVTRADYVAFTEGGDDTAVALIGEINDAANVSENDERLAAAE